MKPTPKVEANLSLEDLLLRVAQRGFAHKEERRKILRLRGPIKKRLKEAFGDAKELPTHVLMHRVFPDDFSYKRAIQGGPPGCVRAFKKALRMFGYLEFKGTVLPPRKRA